MEGRIHSAAEPRVDEGTKGLWRRLVEPSPAVEDRLERRRVRLLSTLLFILMFLLPAGIVARYFVSGVIGTDQATAGPPLVIAYLLSRTRRTVLAAAVGIVALSTPCYVATYMLAQSHPENAWHALIWLSLPMFFTSFIQGVRGTALANGLISAGAFITALALPEIVREDLIVAASLLFVVAWISVGAAVIQRRDRRAISRELAQRQRAEEELRLAKDGLEVRVAERTSELQEANERLSALIRSSPAAVVIQDREDRVVLWNPAAERIFGWAEAEVLGEPSPLRHASGDGGPLLGSGPDGSSVGGERVTSTRDGKPVHVTVSAAPLRAEDGQVTGHMAILVDRAEQKRLEERLRQAEKLEAIGQLAGGVAHDFNNLLTVMNGLTDVTLSEMEADDPRREDLEEIREAGGRAASLTRQLLAFGRRQRLNPEPLDLNEVVYSVAAMLRRLTREDVRLEIRPGADLGLVKADAGQIEQVLLNLVVNASDAMPEGGTVRIETASVERRIASQDSSSGAEGDEWVALTVSDDGQGMPPEVRERVFEPFFTTKDVGHGTGLGLATVYGVVAQSGGHIEVESEPGEGTSFTVYLPLAGDQARREGPAIGVPRGSEVVLVVEDEKGVRDLAARLLRELGYEVLAAADGHDAIVVFETAAKPVELVLTDVVMPTMGGPDCVERLRAIRTDFRVLYMSGHAERALRGHGALGHEERLLEKPFSREELARSVRAALDG